MRILVWLVRAFVFFALFAFALNNQQEAIVRWFFGVEWRAPMVIIVLVAFAAGCTIGVLAMVPSWWRHRRVARRIAPEPVATAPAAPAAIAVPPAETAIPEHPPRDGL
ncbi:LapA family protein [Aquincola sp. MAHUQ-54]|uniref:LapA family protein n=1 Tax=Aquincola agrisoli TaxID=3119538 RepID=A0AAW9Q4T8_9BURK